MKILALLFPLFALTATAQRARIREIRYSIKNDTLVFPIVLTADTAANRKINRTIKETVFDPDEPGASVTSLIRQSIKEYRLYDLEYTVSWNKNGILSLNVHWEGVGAHPGYSNFYFNFDMRTGATLQLHDLIAPERMDSFKAMLLRNKQQLLMAYKEGDLQPMFANKEIDSDTYKFALEKVDSEYMTDLNTDDFSISTAGLTVFQDCEFPYAVRGLSPDCDLGSTYTALAPFLKPAFAPRIKPESPDYRLIHFTSPHNCFPDTGRNAGHLDGDDKFQPRKGHYDDSSVLLVVPRAFKPKQKIDLVFWYHGWHNNIDTALHFYGLARQFAASQVNAILVLPEAGKNVADSYGGKMNQKGMFRLLTNDVIAQLKKQGLAPKNAQSGNVILAGHSGAFLVIANILDNGDQPVSEVWLFDALYSHIPSFMNWITYNNQEHHFVNWFTNKGGGTDEVSDTMMTRLKEKGWPFRLVEESAVTPSVLTDNRIVFIHSPREHNVIINDPDDFQLLLDNSLHLTRSEP